MPPGPPPPLAPGQDHPRCIFFSPRQQAWGALDRRYFCVVHIMRAGAERNAILLVGGDPSYYYFLEHGIFRAALRAFLSLNIHHDRQQAICVRRAGATGHNNTGGGGALRKSLAAGRNRKDEKTVAKVASVIGQIKKLTPRRRPTSAAVALLVARWRRSRRSPPTPPPGSRRLLPLPPSQEGRAHGAASAFARSQRPCLAAQWAAGLNQSDERRRLFFGWGHSPRCCTRSRCAVIAV